MRPRRARRSPLVYVIGPCTVPHERRGQRTETGSSGAADGRVALLSLVECDPQGYTAGMSQDVIATVLTGIGVLFGVWRLVHAEMEGVRRDLSAQIAGVNTRIDNVLLADRKHS